METREQKLQREYREAVKKANYLPTGTLTFMKAVKDVHDKRDELLYEQSAKRRHDQAIEQINYRIRRRAMVATSAQKIATIAIGLILLYLAYHFTK